MLREIMKKSGYEKYEETIMGSSIPSKQYSQVLYIRRFNWYSFALHLTLGIIIGIISFVLMATFIRTGYAINAISWLIGIIVLLGTELYSYETYIPTELKKKLDDLNDYKSS